MNTVLQASHLGKKFKIFSGPLNILKEWLTLGRRSYHSDFWALKDVSFEVTKGEFIGIIGPNGAGKSTLLRILTDVLHPTEGECRVHGRILSILELSGGIDDDLTGRENVIRNGRLFNFPDHYVQDRMEQIKEFSELGDFFEQPMKTYSSGMRSRLSFSMFVFMETDILILDEVLAVGDIFFKQKCFERLLELIEKNVSIILVTHSLGIVQRYCKRVVLLNEGQKIFDGNPGEAIRLFMQLRGEKRAAAIRNMEWGEAQVTERVFRATQVSNVTTLNPGHWPARELFQYQSFPKLQGKGRVEMLRLAVLNDQNEPTLVFKQGERINIYSEFQLKQDIESPLINVEIRDKFNLLIHAKNAIQNQTVLPERVSRGSRVLYYQNIVLNIAAGVYVVNLRGTILPSQGSDRLETRGYGTLAGNRTPLWKLDRAFAIVVEPRYGEDIEIPHGGLCNLPGESIFWTTSSDQ
jgi:ABC-type polysaccharide/polyol phosphate transport system ATPase subunit